MAVFRACRFWCLLMLLPLVGCETLSYYQQAVVGQLTLLSQRRPVTEVIADEATNPEIRERLETAQDILAFAADIGLPVDETFAQYADVGRPYVVWNIFAAPEFSTNLVSWCFPVAGCVGYRGYFNEDDAEAYKKQLEAEGYDVFMGGVSAYSTLGWFEDPLLNTFIRRRDEYLAAVIFHELAHKVLYVQGDTTFNESFATAVERYVLQHWLTEQGRPELFESYSNSDNRRGQVVELILDTREKLAMLYLEQIPEDEMRERKLQIIEQLRVDYGLLQTSWGQGQEYAYWMETPINNAKLGAVGAYQGWLPAFESMLAESDSLVSFFANAQKLADLDRETREQRLEALVKHSPL